MKRIPSLVGKYSVCGISIKCHAPSSLNPEVVDDPVFGDGGRLRLAQPPLQILGQLLGVAQLDLVVVDAPRHILDGQQRLLQLLGQGQGRICSMMDRWLNGVFTY